MISFKAFKISIWFMFVFALFFSAKTNVFAVPINNFTDFQTEIAINNYDIQITGDFTISAVPSIANLGTVTGASGGSFLTLNSNNSAYFNVGGGKEMTLGGNLIFRDFNRNGGNLDGGVFNINGIVNFSYSSAKFINNSVEGSFGVGIGYGGAVYIMGDFNIDNSNMLFYDNRAIMASGGAIDVYNGNFSVNNSTVIFDSNLMNMGGMGGAGFGGGGIFSLGTIDFLNSFVEFVSNSAPSGGGIYAHNGSITNTDDSIINFSMNTAQNGAAIYAYNNSKFDIKNSSLNFIKNSAQYGGAGIAITGRANIAISGADINFMSNSSLYGAGIDSSGDLYHPSAANSGMRLDVRDSNIKFISNTAQNKGGGIYAGGSSDIDFDNSTILFAQNSSDFSGAALFVRMDDSIDFTNSRVSFIKNFSRVIGAAINIGGYRDGNPVPQHFNFTNSEVDFILNSSKEYDTDDNENYYSGGGAVNNGFGSKMNFINSTVNFTSNSVVNQGSGGAIHIDGGASLNISSSIVLFSFNSSPENGGALYFNGAGASTISGHFIGNSADINGGALYAKGRSSSSISDITISADIRDTLFENNKAVHGQDIYLDGNINLFFNASSGKAILVNGGIEDAANSNVVKIGLGDARIKSQFDINGKVTAAQGKLIINVKNPNIGSLLIEENGDFSIINENNDVDRQTIAGISGDTQIKGKYSLDINFRRNYQSDYIHSVGTITISTQNSKVVAQLWGQELKYQYLLVRNGIMIAETESAVIGEFAGLEISTAIPTDLTVSYNGGRVFVSGASSPISTELIINYKGKEIWIEPIEITNFNDIALTHNQKELALLLNSDAVWDGKMASLADKIAYIAIAKRYKDVRKIFDQMHGEFYPNVMRTAAINIEADGIFARMKPKSAQDETEDLWGELNIAGGQYGANDNLNGDFNYQSFGAKFGKDLEADENNFLGIYASLAKGWYEQGADRADGIDIEFGAYKAIFSESKFEHKFNADIGVQFYEVK
ncbi:MAG: hypothetical protein LBN20_01700, partial [Endomicrobium sp.]|nr:hypothetical protein [Endomicrobium sp.]